MKKISIGGQAVLEGIMMKGKDSYSLSVRKPDGDIEVEVTDYVSFNERCHTSKIPIVRGVLAFIESLYIGLGTLMKSSEYMEDEEETDKKADSKTEMDEKMLDKKEKEEGDKAYIIGTLVLSLIFAIGLFMLLPAFISNLLYKVTDRHWIVNLSEGLIRMGIFLLYVIVISKMPDIKRTFMYHGAEHKAINCMEAGDDLTPENVLKHTRFHRRCGTSFLFIVMFVSIIVFMFVKTDVIWLRLLSRILLIPVIGGISYEFIRYAGAHDNAISRILSAPGLWIQRLTTKEPDLAMAEVAIKAVEAVIDWREYVKCVREDSFED
ncbi:MAG: DUF1385 domain-containing protein [Eubacterium sp.]|nr:DUF1385 domain-containing protein [Eubacterium sp.]